MGKMYAVVTLTIQCIQEKWIFIIIPIGYLLNSGRCRDILILFREINCLELKIYIKISLILNLFILLFKQLY